MNARPRVLRLLLLVAVLGIGLVLTRHWPSEQSVHIVLGDAAPGVQGLSLGYTIAEGAPSSADGATADRERQVTFHYAKTGAPRIVTHEPRLVSGEYDVDIEIERTDTSGSATAPKAVTVRRRVLVDGHPVSIDVSKTIETAFRPAGSAATR